MPWLISATAWLIGDAVADFSDAVAAAMRKADTQLRHGCSFGMDNISYAHGQYQPCAKLQLCHD
jgi:hypothetical protein